MASAAYDSPTFLSQKDKYFMGLSLPQLMAAVGVAFFWFLVTLAFPYSTWVRMAIMAPLTSLSVALMFVRISGLSIPVYLGLALVRLFSRPSYEDSGVFLLQGQPEWLESERLKAQSEGIGSKLRRQRGRVRGVDTQAKQAELQAEMDKSVTEGSVALEQMVRDGVRTLVRGG